MSSNRAVVLGAPRSGTTFLMSVLTTFPAAECVTGNLWPIGIAHLAAQEIPTETREVLERSFRGALSEYLTSADYHSRPAALRKWWRASRRMGDLPRAARGERVETMLIYKEPFLAFCPELPYRALADSPLIYIIRDGRDVADSLVRTYDVLSDEKLSHLESAEVFIGRASGQRFVPWWVGEGREDEFLDASPYVRAVWMWSVMSERCRRFFDRPEVAASGRVLRVRYEDLVSEPVAQGEAIASHLGQPLTARTRRQLQSSHPRSVGVHAHRPQQEIEQAQRIAALELGALGYPVDAPTRGAGAAAG